MQGMYTASINVQGTQGEGVKLYWLLDHCISQKGQILPLTAIRSFNQAT